MFSPFPFVLEAWVLCVSSQRGLIGCALWCGNTAQKQPAWDHHSNFSRGLFHISAHNDFSLSSQDLNPAAVSGGKSGGYPFSHAALQVEPWRPSQLLHPPFPYPSIAVVNVMSEFPLWLMFFWDLKWKFFRQKMGTYGYRRKAILKPILRWAAEILQS